MDLNYLLHRHQVSLMRADAAATGEGRHAHRGLAHGYAQQIETARTASGAFASMTLVA